MTLPETPPCAIAELAVTVYRAPVARPVRTAFGAMTDRPAVIVRARADDGATGYGEIWCNFPTCGAEHRARLVTSFLAPLVVGRRWRGPAEVFHELTGRASRLALQAGEPGPLAQAVAGIDIALWDLAARRAGQPLWRLLGGRGDGRLPAYASGINPDQALAQARAARDAGYRAFKLKIGFGRATDLENLAALREELGPDAPIAVDANQAWELEEARSMSRALAEFRPLWLEEPIAADRPIEEWQQLAAASRIPLAGGENLRGDAQFDAAIAAGALAIFQPDVAKWGGITGCLPLARRDHRGRPALLPALARRRHRAARLGPPAGRRRRRRPARDRLQSQPVARRSCDASPDARGRPPGAERGAGLGVEPGPEVERYARDLA